MSGPNVFGFFFPEEYKIVEALLTMKAAEPVTLADQVQEALDQLVAIQRELDNQNVRLAVAS